MVTKYSSVWEGALYEELSKLEDCLSTVSKCIIMGMFKKIVNLHSERLERYRR